MSRELHVCGWTRGSNSRAFLYASEAKAMGGGVFTVSVTNHGAQGGVGIRDVGVPAGKRYGQEQR